MAQAVAEGAGTERNTRTLLLHASETTAEHVLNAHGYVFVTPETLGSMAGLMKDFFDRTYYAALDQINGRPYTVLVCAGSDGQGAVKQIQRIATGWRLTEMAPPHIVCTHAQTPEKFWHPKPLPLRICNIVAIWALHSQVVWLWVCFKSPIQLLHSGSRTSFHTAKARRPTVTSTQPSMFTYAGLSSSRRPM